MGLIEHVIRLRISKIHSLKPQIDCDRNRFSVNKVLNIMGNLNAQTLDENLRAT